MLRDTQPLFTQKHLFILGCGYLGQHVAREALRRGMRVTALTRNAAQAAALRAQGGEVIVADLASDDWHDHAPREVDYVLNCVSARSDKQMDTGQRARAQKKGLRPYVDGMRSLTCWMRKAVRIGTVVYTSSTGVYPQGGGVTVDEDFSVAPPDTDTRAGILSTAEQVLQRECAPLRTRWFILRLAGLYGPGRSHLLDQVLKNAALHGDAHESRIGVQRVSVGAAPSHRLNLVHVEDAAAAIWAAFVAPATLANRIYNVADDAPTPKHEVLTWLAEQVGVLPLSFDNTAALSASEPANREGGTARRRIVPDRLISNARLKRELGWRPRYPDYRAGYARMLSH